MDSSDMTPEDWQHIADDIKAHYDQYDGFVILHGTDTMAFTASALSFMLENLGKPVIVTGSQIPLAELRSDGQINLLNSGSMLAMSTPYRLATGNIDSITRCALFSARSLGAAKNRRNVLINICIVVFLFISA
jgi:L-asparaginase/Glu-tRNA(Gln) amidotransferase subunit D